MSEKPIIEVNRLWKRCPAHLQEARMAAVSRGRLERGRLLHRRLDVFVGKPLVALAGVAHKIKRFFRPPSPPVQDGKTSWRAYARFHWRFVARDDGSAFRSAASAAGDDNRSRHLQSQSGGCSSPAGRHRFRVFQRNGNGYPGYDRSYPLRAQGKLAESVVEQAKTLSLRVNMETLLPMGLCALVCLLAYGSFALWAEFHLGASQMQTMLPHGLSRVMRMPSGVLMGGISLVGGCSWAFPFLTASSPLPSPRTGCLRKAGESSARLEVAA